MNIKPGFIVKSGRFTASYSFAFNPTNCELEPNNSAGTATRMESGKKYLSYIGHDGGYHADGDWFAIECSVGATYEIAFKNYSKLAATTAIISVYDPSGNRNNVGYYIKNVNASGDSCYTFTAQTSGTYYVSIVNYSKQQISYEIYYTNLSSSEPTEPSAEPTGPTKIPSANFKDVASNAWYKESVDYAVANGLMNGMGNNTFEPDTPTNRAMLVTVLWRYAGSPVDGTNIFSDVPNGQWYTQAVAWGAKNGIVSGMGNNKFEPDGTLTREQLATILFRYAKLQNLDTSARADFSKFEDGKQVQSWSKDAVQWAVAEGIIGGTSENGKLYSRPAGQRHPRPSCNNPHALHRERFEKITGSITSFFACPQYRNKNTFCPKTKGVL